jgi:hypothetical protein
LEKDKGRCLGYFGALYEAVFQEILPLCRYAIVLNRRLSCFFIDFGNAHNIVLSIVYCVWLLVFLFAPRDSDNKEARLFGSSASWISVFFLWAAILIESIIRLATGEGMSALFWTIILTLIIFPCEALLISMRELRSRTADKSPLPDIVGGLPPDQAGVQFPDKVGNPLLDPKSGNSHQ